MMPTTPIGWRCSDDAGEERDQAAAAARAQEARAAPRVVAGGDRHIDDFLEGVPPRLARLQLHEVEDLVAPVEHAVVEAQQHLASLGDRQLPPIVFCAPRARSTAANTSSRVASGISPIGLPVNGASTAMRLSPGRGVDQPLRQATREFGGARGQGCVHAGAQTSFGGWNSSSAFIG